jgi:hypothetical protein
MKRRRYAKTYNRPTPGAMNKGEQKYSKYLQIMKLAGEVDDFWFEGIKLRIGPSGARCMYTPDFLVQRTDGTLELVDVKGRKGDSYWAEDDAKVKMRAVADKYPFRMVIVWPKKDGSWGREEI